MALLYLIQYLLFFCLNSFSEGNSAHLPRMTFTDKDTSMTRFALPGHHSPVRIVLEGEPHAVIAAGKKHLNVFSFQNPEKSVEISVSWRECINNTNCNYDISVIHKREEDNQVFLCGTNGKETVCCDMNLSEQSPRCSLSEKTKSIKGSIKEFVIKEGEPSALVESPDSDLFITYSGAQEYVGIYKFGRNRVAPARHDREQQYVGLVVSRRKDNPKQGKVYGFYKEKNKETGMYSDMWLPFVTRVCKKDRGGPKNTLQFSWTSQMNARLFCGDVNSRQHFSELVDVATVDADHWQNTRIYALFRNQWNMSAVCVYTIQDIDDIFTTSPFKGPEDQPGRSRGCVPDSTKISPDVLMMIEKNSEMEESVRPANNSGPLLSSRHSYTRIHVDSFDDHDTVLFLSLNNGEIHKAVQSNSHAFIIAEYQPFNHRAHVLDLVLHPSSRKLYVASSSELVQLDVAHCAQYGDSCEGCVLSRDPYCGWNGTQCSPSTNDTLQELTGNHFICGSSSSAVELPVKVLQSSITLPPGSKYFLQCPISSHHAQYTWRHLGRSSTLCSSRERQCLLLIDSMGPEQEGNYTCESEEMGYSRVLVQQQLRLESRAESRSSGLLVGFSLIAALIKSWSC